MLNLNDFILLKAIFNEQLHDAVLEKDADKILGIVNKRYQFELQNGFVQQEDLNVTLTGKALGTG
jgi:hypothetical protein